MFKLMLHNNAVVFYSFLIVTEHQNASNERIAGGQWVFVCLEGYILQFFSLTKIF